MFSHLGEQKEANDFISFNGSRDYSEITNLVG